MHKTSLLLLSGFILSGQTLATRTFGGSGNDAVTGVAVDTRGNIYVTGTTTSFDLPVLHASQAANSGTALMFSTDAGRTWKPLSNPAPPPPYQAALPLAVDPTNPAVLYVASNLTLLKSTDGGQTFAALTPLPVRDHNAASIGTIVIDPSHTQTLYVTAVPQGIFKTVDGGTTWHPKTRNLPRDISIDSLTMDPFHPQSLWIWAGGGGYGTSDGAATWVPVPLPFPNNIQISGGFRFIFDQVKAGVIYGPAILASGSIGIQKSVDGGQTWSPLMTPFQGEAGVVADPVRAGYLYNVTSPIAPGAAEFFYRSTDGGTTWQSFPFPGRSSPMVASDPANPDILIAGTYSSTNGGQTWMPNNASRDAWPVFAPGKTGLVYASAPPTSDAFLAEFAPDGKTLLFATYFGGMGNDSASGIRIDSAGNLWITGTTSSFDLPAAGTGYQKALKGAANVFVAEFTPDGQPLAATYLGGSGMDSAKALRLDSSGNPWLTGVATSADFPITASNASNNTNGGVFVAGWDHTLTRLLVSTYVAGMGQNAPGGLTIDPNDNVIVNGTSYTGGFPLVGNAIHAPDSSAGKMFVVKYDHSGNVLFSTYLGGSQQAPLMNVLEGFENVGVAAASGPDGSIYLTGSTSFLDFPTTAGAYQTRLKGDGCPYPAFVDNTGFIGSIPTYLNDDLFITKMKPDGSALEFSTLLGGTCYDRPTDIALTASGQVVVAGETDSIDFPVLFPVETPPGLLEYKSFVSMLDAQGANLLYSTYLLAGSSPVLAPSPDGTIHLGGAIGYQAQTQTYSGEFFTIAPKGDALLASIDPTAATPGLNLVGVLNDFSLLPGPVAPGEIVRLQAPNFHPAQTIDVGLNDAQPLATTLAGTQVLFDGQPAQLIAVHSGKIVCIAPQLSAATTLIQIKSGATVSNIMAAETAPSAIGLLSATGSGSGDANARNGDGSLNTPANPAKPGSIITLYFTGSGSPPQSVSVNGTLVDTAPLPGFVPGIYAAYFKIPAQVFPPSLPVTALTGTTFSSSQTLTVYVTTK